ncbi:MAG: hydantoinase/oxoprolinase family protein, partial [Nitrospinae bacterium]|nr:hydantoinase/oxoprolinase family protein [Nitrospinota bacterium]
MRLGIGIDTGGTFTDSVVIDLDSKTVLSKAKSLTTKHDLRLGIDGSLSGLDAVHFPNVKLVSLSTTLATNSVVEGKGSRVGLIVAVPNPATFKLPSALPAEKTYIVSGSHGKNGEETVSLDVESALNAVRLMKDEVDSFAVSGYFGIYNADHEIRIKKLISAECGHPVVCGHELSGQVGMMERAVTATLNGKLLPVIGELLDAVDSMISAHGINAPLMVVKGDGSLISEKVARARPVETVLSGPAASIVGAGWLTGRKNAVVVDMGGTTTDIGIMENGIVSINAEGAVVGGWRTRVRAVDMWTIGLGGDSKIDAKPGGEITIGPRRAMPICSAAVKFPGLKKTLDELLRLASPESKNLKPGFYTLVKRPSYAMPKYDSALADALDGRALTRLQIEEEVSQFVDIEKLVRRGIIVEISPTPTDMLHATGQMNMWDGEASMLAVQLLMKHAGMTEAGFLKSVHETLIETLKINIVTKSLHEDYSLRQRWSEGDSRLLGYLLGSNENGGVAAKFRLAKPLIAVGAPVKSYFPRVAEELNCHLDVPDHAEIANAVGAVTGCVTAIAQAHIRPDKLDGYVVVAADERRRFETLEEAVEFAEEHVRAVAECEAVKNGGEGIITTV